MLLFLHLPKTGGQSLSARLATGFAPERCWTMRGDVESPDHLRDLLPGHDLIAAHVRAGALTDLPAEVQVISVVRHPFEQLRSSLMHARRDPGNPLHRPAQELPVRDFLSGFADMLMNFQSRSMVAAFHASGRLRPDTSAEMWVAERLPGVLARLTWLLPTEEMDDFCRWWPIEAGRPISANAARVNVTPPQDGTTQQEVAAFAAENPHFFALDLLLWREAQRRYALWRDKVAAAAVPVGPDHMRGERADAGEEDSGIWLDRGWYPAERQNDGVRVWWAGPENCSIIRLRRAPGQTRLRFELACLLRVTARQVRVVAAGGTEPLPQDWVTLPSGMTEVVVTLPEGGAETELELWVPFVTSTMQAVRTGGDAVRRSLATRHWRLE